MLTLLQGGYNTNQLELLAKICDNALIDYLYSSKCEDYPNCVGCPTKALCSDLTSLTNHIQERLTNGKRGKN